MRNGMRMHGILLGRRPTLYAIKTVRDRDYAPSRLYAIETVRHQGSTPSRLTGNFPRLESRRQWPNTRRGEVPGIAPGFGGKSKT
jgi:hypothetical protein